MLTIHFIELFVPSNKYSSKPDPSFHLVFHIEWLDLIAFPRQTPDQSV